ncbi:hypothetical protein L1049_014521 [Liquidambar formosana]|uniref:non-specific serine/threonine protein kinase n=1 Tax=Liquidambar formosana TaxID=63359 RepID=A0AAP0RXD2_LIQFO
MSAQQIFRQWHMLLSFFFSFLTLVSLSESDEHEILLKFKSALEKSETNVFDSWGENYSICSFTGIVCDSNSLVKEIDLPQRNLTGVLPFDSICQLQSLEKLSLGENSLHGGVSEDLRNCTRLQYLDLGRNSFTGEVPDLSSLSQLKFLNLNTSGFSGPFPWKSLENLTQLEFLSLGDNPFHTSSFPTEVLKLTNLNWLYLTNCSLTGQIPADIGNLTELGNLELSENQLSGELPTSIAKLQKLYQLELYNNNFTGKLPVGFGNLTGLINFDASQNSLEGDLSELRFLTRLVSLQLFQNRFSGEIPNELGEFKNLVNLSLYTNKLTGSLPAKLGSWTDFNYIDVSENFLTGPIPPEMCKNGRMGELLMLQNNFTGGIPENYANCSSLKRFRVSHNLLSGTVPAGIWSLPNLNIIDLASNQFEGTVGANIGNAKSLAQLLIAGNRFTGELPASISTASSLVAMDLSSNQFSGEIPIAIGELKKLSSLYLNDNMFSGSIPNSIGSCAAVSVINLAGNELSGKIPASIGYLRSLNSLNLSGNKLSGEIPSSLSLLRLSLLDLSNNTLVGSIPEALSIEAFKGSFAGNAGLCSQKIRQFRRCSSDSGGMSGKVRTAVSCFIAGASILVVSLACFIFIKSRPKNPDRPMRSDSWDLKPYRALAFTEQEIINSIKHENLIGKGSSGNVYRVVLNNGQELAVKHMWKSDSVDRRSCRSSVAMLKARKSRSPEYDAEVATLSSVRHVNVVKLYCSVTSEDSDLLVYEYMCNGSLWDRLHTCQKMEMGWEVRYEIAVGSARGLEYLHHGCDRPVIHRDVKSSNILLDEELKPRIADFGLAKVGLASGVWDSTHVIAGTLGYIAPGKIS